MKHLNIAISLFFVLLCVFSLNCKRLVEVGAPVTSENSANVFAEDVSAISAVTGIYTQMSLSGLLGATSINSFMFLYPELSADELVLYNTGDISMSQYYLNTLSNSVGENIWSSIYPYIYKINSCIEGLSSSLTLSSIVKNQLLGEAKFLRAYHYFYLTNLYGDVPLVLSSDYKINSNLAKSPESQVYQQILQDLNDASLLLEDKYPDASLLNSTSERVRPTKWAVDAMLARVHLYLGNYSQADSASSILIKNTGLFSLVGIDSVFLKASLGNNEAIWQLQPINTGWNTEVARVYLLPSGGPNTGQWPVYLSSDFLASFENGDQRRYHWVDSVIVSSDTFYFPYKYRSATYDSTITEYETDLRLAEQFLIRAEARAYGAGSGLSGAISDLNIIRTRASLPNYKGDSSQSSVLSAIFHERRIELFAEMGHRWLDLKRTSAVDSVMSAANLKKGGLGWNSYQKFYPIPPYDIEYDKFLTQNLGY